MKNKFLYLLLLLFTVSFIYLGNKKEGMFVDEIYSYGLSNSYYAPFVDDIKDLSKGWAIYEKEDFQNYMEVQEETERFSYSSVYYNQTQDVHPPLFYMVMHTISSFFPHSHSKWIGLGINLFLFILLIALLYYLCLLLFKRSDLALFFCAIYIFSTAGMSTALMIRMYTLLTLLTICFALLVYVLMSGKNKWYIYLGLMLTTWLGLFTQYYFVFYFCFVSIAYLIWAFIKKQSIKNILLYLLFVVFGCAIMLLSFPSLISHLFSDKLVSGTNAFSNLFDFSRWVLQAKGYFKEIVRGFYVATGLFCVLIFSIIILRKRIFIDKNLLMRVGVLVFPAICNLFLVIIISPVVGIRYVYNIFPILLLLLPYMISLLLSVRDISFGRSSMLFLALLNAIPVFALKAYEPNCMYVGATSIRDEISEKYEHCPCLYISKGVHQCMTADLLELERFDEVFLSKNGLCQEAKDYLLSFNEKYLILYIGSTREKWYEPTDPNAIIEQVLSTGLYENPLPRSTSINWLRESYVLTRKQQD